MGLEPAEGVLEVGEVGRVGAVADELGDDGLEVVQGSDGLEWLGVIGAAVSTYRGEGEGAADDVERHLVVEEARGEPAVGGSDVAEDAGGAPVGVEHGVDVVGAARAGGVAHPCGSRREGPSMRMVEQ